MLPVPIHEVDYEETVADLEGVARRLVAACGLEWEPACLEFHRTAAAGPHRQRHPGPPADLPAIGRPLEELRARAGRAVRPTALRKPAVTARILHRLWNAGGRKAPFSLDSLPGV